MFIAISDLGDGLLYSLVCVLIVFFVLAVICTIVSLMKFIKKPEAKTETVVSAPVPTTKRLTIEDITDEDMMVAALIATIDYRNEVKTDVRLVSIKQIN